MGEDTMTLIDSFPIIGAGAFATETKGATAHIDELASNPSSADVIYFLWNHAVSNPKSRPLTSQPPPIFARIAELNQCLTQERVEIEASLSEVVNTTESYPWIAKWELYVYHRLAEYFETITDVGVWDPGSVMRAWQALPDLIPSNAPSPSVVPNGEGGVQFVWRKFGYHIKIEFAPPGDYVWVRNLNDHTAWHGSLETRRVTLRRVLKLISAS
jgi:hypothetical protein